MAEGCCPTPPCWHSYRPPSSQSHCNTNQQLLQEEEEGHRGQAAVALMQLLASSSVSESVSRESHGTPTLVEAAGWLKLVCLPAWCLFRRLPSHRGAGCGPRVHAVVQ